MGFKCLSITISHNNSKQFISIIMTDAGLYMFGKLFRFTPRGFVYSYAFERQVIITFNRF